MPRTILLFAVATALSLPSCSSEAAAGPSVARVPKGLEDVSLVIPDDNPLTQTKASLGHLLFFDKRLSSDGSMSCSTCHLPDKAWTDGKRFSKKVDGSMNTRNSPTLYNVGYQPHYYWDGRAPTLEKNVAAAWEGHMGGDGEKMAKAIAEVPAYAKQFDAAFEDGVTGGNIVKALCSFVRSLRAGDSPYDHDKLSPAAQRGKRTYATRCSMCHVGALFTDFKFHNVGVGEKPDPGRGKFDEKLQGAFKTPSLRNVTKTAPYFHDGSVATLREAVTIMAHGGIDNEHLDPILNGVRAMPELKDSELDDLLEFLKALESPYDHEPPKVP